MFEFSSDIEEELPSWLSEAELLPRWNVLTQFAFPNIQTHISLLLVDDSSIKEINRVRRNKDYSTDVLSFPLSFDLEPWDLPPKKKIQNSPLLSLGEIVISWDTCKAQAKSIGHSEEDEFFRLFVHGFLHLIGYDHERGEEDEALMKEKEDLCLDLVLGP
ncbi:rRNA maturation RNase YbeY [Leptospira semungkisensis]|uniref:Endoribonuclease YbeY n=1 Tax=Leptospira semungkisensis TaxID=2484985 RepID=A0A4R9FSG5_9LEPT|nr:rRNA maturation RNase YbeY [Leptospira semungkisensis]